MSINTIKIYNTPTQSISIKNDAPVPELILQEKTITENGTYRADSGFAGLSKVTVNFDINKYIEQGRQEAKNEFITEVEITSAISNMQELADIVFENSNIKNNLVCAVLKKPKNNTIINNQVVYLYASKIVNGACAIRYRDGIFSQILNFNTNYDASVTIGDIYEVFNLGEINYDN